MNYFTPTQASVSIQQNSIIYVPNGMPKIIKKIFELEGIKFIDDRKRPVKSTHTKFERLLLIVSSIYRQLDKKETFSVSNKINHEDLFDLSKTEYLEYELQLGYTFLGYKCFMSDKKTILGYRDLLEKYNLICKVKNSAHMVGRADTFIVSSKFARYSQAYTITTPGLAQQVIDNKKEYQLKLNTMKNYTDIINNIHTYSMPTREFVINDWKASKLGTKNSEGKIYVDGYQPSDFTTKTKIKYGKRYDISVKTNHSVVDINEGIDIYLRFLDNGLLYKEFSEYTRFYTSFSLMPKGIRELILIDGQPIIANDYSSFHSVLLNYRYAYQFNAELIDLFTGDSHQKIADLFGITRDEAKAIALRYWNSYMNKNIETTAKKENKALFKKMDEYLFINEPDFFQMIYEIKNPEHNNMNKILFQMEREIMDMVIDEIIKDEPYIYTYDCVYMTRDISTEMLNIIPKYFANKNINAKKIIK